MNTGGSSCPCPRWFLSRRYGVWPSMFVYGRFENIPAVSKSRPSNAEAALTSLMCPLRGYSITELNLEHLKRGGATAYVQHE